MAVVGEPYRQWVLQDAFVAARPRWEIDGALVVPDVAPYQLMKLRLLNGSHSAMAYLGAAAGCTTVADVLATEWGERLVRAFGAEVAPTLPDPIRAGLDAAALRRRPRRPVPQPRHAPPAAPDRLGRIAEDPRAVVPGPAGPARGLGGDAGARAGPGRLGQRDAARSRPRHDGPRHGRAEPLLDRHVRPEGPGRVRCCAPSAPPTSPSRRTSPRPSPPGSRRCAPDRSTSDHHRPFTEQRSTR